MKIIQITQGERGIIGLSDEGDLYVLRNKYKSTPKTEEEIKLEQTFYSSNFGEAWVDPMKHDLIGEEWQKIEVIK